MQGAKSTAYIFLELYFFAFQDSPTQIRERSESQLHKYIFLSK